MNDSSLRVRQLLNNFNLNKGDTVMLVSDISTLLHSYKKNNTYYFEGNTKPIN